MLFMFFFVSENYHFRLASIYLHPNCSTKVLKGNQVLLQAKSKLSNQNKVICIQKKPYHILTLEDAIPTL